jgi:hypothetical protein
MNTTIDQNKTLNTNILKFIGIHTNIHIRILMMICTFTTAVTVPDGFEVSGIWKIA